ncbi:2-hydroxychromene-2-carboxylate isomerase [Fodinicurvata sp. EGI_FJ10296]|uniref:2-hydroxychromene-2-carboxylate isomerase n=1 Tax=Fodinicurvata sp. EGI_FJ10296 TaxID=3231908 RepID=UPI003452E767
MTKSVDYYCFLSSPWTYLGSARLYEIAARHGATIAHRPVDLAKIFPVSGGLPLAKRAIQRQRYRMAELQRWRDFLDVPLTLEPKYFPVDTIPASQLVVAADTLGHDPGPLAHAILRAVWAEERDIADPATLTAIADAAGFDGKALITASADDDVRHRFDAFTQEAIDRDVFGSPTYIVNGDLFWGQDRLDFVDRALAAA